MAVPPEDFAVVEDVEDFVVVLVTPATFPETPAATLPAGLPGIERMPKSIVTPGISASFILRYSAAKSEAAKNLKNRLRAISRGKSPTPSDIK